MSAIYERHATVGRVGVSACSALSIVRAIATAHGAALTADAPPGGGPRIEVVLPSGAGPSGPGRGPGPGAGAE
jgi:hypothetical protein